jgi:parallel beta-helix repeat protein
MHNDSSAPTITDCTFSGNSATTQRGGGMYNYSSSDSTVANCTFSGNSAGTDGGAMCNVDGCSPTLANCIVWANVAPSGPGIHDDDTSSAAVTYSCIQGGWAGDGNIDLDPLFADDDLRLQDDSPCIDTGDPAFVPDPGDTDLDGHPRVLCGQVDMGAYEFGIGDYDCDRDVDLNDFAAWEACMTGPDGGPYDPGCESFDFEFDGDVDLDDFALFQQQFSGP